MSAVKLEHVAKHYADVSETLKVINDCNLTVERGDFVTVTGPSGSGKSTLLKLLFGETLATEGVVTVLNNKLNSFTSEEDIHILRKRIGFVHQDPVYIEYITLIENVKLSLSIAQKFSSEEIERIAEQSLDSLGLGARKNVIAGKLSGGEKQRMAIAMAMVKGCDLLLCDEPTGNLNRKGSDEIFELFRGINERYKATIVMVTHDEKLAEQADKQFAFSNSRLERVR